MASGTITVRTNSQMELVDVTSQVTATVAQAGIQEGLCVLYNPHTTAGVTINEGADPAVRRDIIAGLKEFVPLNFPFHHLEGNSPAHIMASLIGSSVTVFIQGGRLLLGTWQKIFFCEFDGPRTRKLHWKILAG